MSKEFLLVVVLTTLLAQRLLMTKNEENFFLNLKQFHEITKGIANITWPRVLTLAHIIDSTLFSKLYIERHFCFKV